MRTNIHRTARCVFSAALLAALTACGESGAVAPVTPVTQVTPTTFTVGGTVTGLAGPGLVLENSYGIGQYDDLAVGGSGSFTFREPLGKGVEYGIGVKTQPLTPPQYCQVGEPNGSGFIGAANVTNVQVTCAAGYTVGGTVSGLAGSGLELQIENTQPPADPSDPEFVGNSLPVNTNGAFTLDSVYPAMFAGGDFVRILQQPSAPTQRCLIENSGIRIQGANDASVVVACSELAYVTNAADNTLSAYRVDATTGALLAVGTPIATGKSPGAVAGTTTRQFVYVGNEGSNDVSAYAVNVETGALTAVPGSPFAAGTDPRALILYFNILYVANRGSNTISAFALDATTGALTALSPATYATGQGPSSLAVDPTGQFLYVANSGGSNDISAFVIGAAGGLTPMAGSPFAAGASPFSLTFGASGKFLYSANPGGVNPSISGFTVDSSGALTPLSGFPFFSAVNRSITADRAGAYLYATAATGVLRYSVDATTGMLTPLPGFPVVSGANTYSVTIDPTSQFLYLANNGSANVAGFRFDASTGGLTPIAGSPFAAGNAADFVTTL
jgi:6-phosphogluconolactonase